MPRERVIAALTIGSTSVMMLLVRRCADGRREQINEWTVNTALSENLDESAAFDVQAMRETAAAVAAMYQIAASEGADRVILVGTSSLRRADNEKEFVQYCRRALDLSYLEILEEQDESGLTFSGASSDFPEDEPIILVDLGGTSTKIVCGSREHPGNAFSIPLGYLHLTHRFHLCSMMFWLFRGRAERLVKNCLGAEGVKTVLDFLREHPRAKVVMSGGILSSLVGLRNGSMVMDRREVHHAVSNAQEVLKLYKRLMYTLPVNRPFLGGVEHDRVRMVPGAFLMILSILKIFGRDDFTITTNGLRLGLVRRFEQMEETEMAFASLNGEGF